MRHSVTLITTAFLGSVLPIYAQHSQKPGPAVYKVEFNIRDGSEGAAETGKHYAMLIDESRKGLLQAGNRFRFPGASGSPQSTYTDVGANIECTLRESAGKTVLEGSLEISKIVPIVSTPEPVINQRKLSFNASLAPGIPSVIIDQKGLQVQATVTRVN